MTWPAGAAPSECRGCHRQCQGLLHVRALLARRDSQNEWNLHRQREAHFQGRRSSQVTTPTNQGEQSPQGRPAAAVYTREDLAALLQVHIRTIDRLVATDTIPGRLKFSGRLLRFCKATVDAW